MNNWKVNLCWNMQEPQTGDKKAWKEKINSKCMFVLSFKINIRLLKAGNGRLLRAIYYYCSSSSSISEGSTENPFPNFISWQFHHFLFPHFYLIYLFSSFFANLPKSNTLSQKNRRKKKVMSFKNFLKWCKFAFSQLHTSNCNTLPRSEQLLALRENSSTSWKTVINEQSWNRSTAVYRFRSTVKMQSN